MLLSAGRFAIYRSESQIYSRFAPRYRNFTSSRLREAFLKRWLTSEYFLRSGLEADTFFCQAMRHGTSPRAMLQLFMGAICDYQHAARWAECTPDNATHLNRILNDFPEALIIHLVRDGRDVALSLAKQAFIRPYLPHRRSPEIAAAAYWHWVVRSVEQSTQTRPENTLIVKYEHLRSDLPETLAAVSRFIGQNLDVRRIENFAIGSISAPNTSFSETALTDDSSNAERWRTRLTGRSLERVEAVIGKSLLRCGYEPQTNAFWMRKAAGSLGAAAYSARFGLSHVLKSRSFLGRFADDGLSRSPPDHRLDDATLRPADHVAEIRQITGA